ncbi:MAG: DAK2 domain-containing protein, partial [Bacilli bacterium]|nr:DAK2 domain-containing protein [Bacilli bacterium]
ALTGLTEMTTSDFMAAFRRGTEASYAAIGDPTEGTILTVMKEVSNLTPDEEFESTLLRMKDQAMATVENTPELMPLLKKAGVVDAGGLGFYYILKAFYLTCLGEKIPETEEISDIFGTNEEDRDDLFFRFCIEGVIKKNEYYKGEHAAEPLRKQLSKMGESEVFIETNGLIKFHIHSNDDQAVMDAVSRYGSLLDFKVDNMQKQVDENANLYDKVAFVPVVAGEGFSAIFSNFLVPQNQINPLGNEASYEEFISAINSLKAKNIVLLPNNQNAIGTCEILIQKYNDGVKKLYFIPTNSQAEGVTALEHYDPEMEIEENIVNMKEAVSNCLTIKVAIASKEYISEDIHVYKGDYVLLKGNHPLATSPNKSGVPSLVREVLGGYDIITVYYGAGVDPDEAEDFSSTLEDILPSSTDVILVEGDQKLFHYLINGEKTN